MLYVMLVGRYPFERPDDARLNDINRTQQMLQVRHCTCIARLLH